MINVDTCYLKQKKKIIIYNGIIICNDNILYKNSFTQFMVKILWIKVFFLKKCAKEFPFFMENN